MLARLTAKRQILTSILALFSMIVFGQKAVTGKITGPDGQPVAGATVTVKGTNVATTTGLDGRYSITVPGNRTQLVVSYVGYETTEVPIGSSGVADLALKVSTTNLNEVVVTGYSAQRKKDITGSVAVINTKELVANPGSNVESLLQGKAAGVTVGTSGVPGAGASIRIRGFTTFNQNEPLYVVDGARAGSISDLNPNDIETMQVLKDGSSAAAYGAAAANGVIIITTKKGRGKAKVNYDAYYGVQKLTKKFNLLNTEEYGQYLLKLQQGIPGQTATSFNLGQYNGGQPTTSTPVIPEYILAGTNSGVQAGDPSADPSLYKLDFTDVNAGSYLIVKANKQGTDWMDEITHPAPMQSHNLSISGGTETGNYLFGLNYFNQDGTIIETGYKRYSIRANTNFVIKKVIRVGENLQVSYIDKAGFTNQDEGNAISMAYRMQPIVPVYDIAGNYAGTRGSNLGNASNPVADRQRSANNKDRRIAMLGSVYAEADFLKYFTIKSVLGMDYGNNWYYYFNLPAYENAEGRTSTSSFGEGQSFGYQMTWYNTLSFHKEFGKHDVRALVGTEMVEFAGRYVDASTNTYFSTDRNFWQVGSGLSTTPSGNSGEWRGRKYSPVIAKLDYNFEDKYLVSASFRRDGSSNAFGPNNKYGNFSSASVGWRISEESFLRDKISWLNDLKLRIGYGILGNDNTVDFGFITSYVFDRGGAGYPIDGGNTSFAPGMKHDKIGNPNIKWEQSSTTDVGLDATLFNNKLNVILDLYTRKTTDLLYDRKLDPIIYGNVAAQPTNIGDMTNKGVDLQVNYRTNINKDIKFDAGISFSLYRNKVGNIADPYFEGSRSRIDPFNRSITGMPISSFYGYIIDGFFQNQADLDAIEQGNEGIGKWRYKDISGPNGKPDGKITPDDRTFMGNPHPKFTTGINLGLTYKNFDFAAMLYWKAGGDIVNYVRYWTDFNTFQGNRDKRVLYDSWTPSNTNAKLPVLDASDGASGQVPVSYYVEPGGYLRLRNLSLGYTIPTAILSKIGVERFRLYVQAQNLFTITKYTGLDPEISTQLVGRGNYRDRRSDANSLGVDYGNFPTPRIISFGVNVTF